MGAPTLFVPESAQDQGYKNVEDSGRARFGTALFVSPLRIDKG